MSHFEIKKHREDYEINVFYSKKHKHNKIYTNIINKDPKKIARVLLDLEIIANYPIEKAIKIYFKLKNKSDWLNL